MDNNNLSYNTKREKLTIPEYGRNLQIMIEHLMEIEDRKKRTAAANFIVGVMAQMNPQVKESNDYLHKLWDHMYIISNYKLDVDGPFEPPVPEAQTSKPEHIGYQKNNIKQGHYGQYIVKVIKEIAKVEDEQKKKTLMISVANQMKRDYLNWNRDNVNDLLILNDLYSISKGQLVLPKDTKLIPTAEVLGKVVQQPQQLSQNKKNKKKKGKKKFGDRNGIV